MPFEVFHNLSQVILEYGFDSIKVSSSLIVSVTPVIQAALAMQIILHGYRIIRGEGGQNHFLDVFNKCLRAFLVFTLVLVGGAYEENLVKLVKGLSQDILVAFGGDPKMDMYQTIDQAMEKGFEAFDKIVKWGKKHIIILIIYNNVDGVWAILAGALLILLILILGVLAFVDLMVIDFGLFIIFGVGPLFVACYAFETTAKFFDTWLAGLLKWVMTATIITVVILLAVHVLEIFVLKLTQGGNFKQVISTILSAIAATVVLMILVTRAPTLATDLVGGIGLNSVLASRAQSMMGSAQRLVKQGAGAAASGGANLAKGAAGAAGKGAVSAGKSVGRGAASAYRGAVRAVGGPGARALESARANVARRIGRS